MLDEGQLQTWRANGWRKLRSAHMPRPAPKLLAGLRRHRGRQQDVAGIQPDGDLWWHKFGGNGLIGEDAKRL